MGIPAAPIFRPTAEEFRDPVAYISRIGPEAAKYGLAHIVPPEGEAGEVSTARGLGVRAPGRGGGTLAALR